MNRRKFIKISALLSTAGLAGSSLLDAQDQHHHQYAGYNALSDLPEFRLDDDMQLRLAIEDFPEAIDFHTHLGFSFLFSLPLDLRRETKETKYIFNCNHECTFDLDLHTSYSFTTSKKAMMNWQLGSQLAFGQWTRIPTHTATNLVNEMNRMRFAQSVLLPIRPGLWFRDDSASEWLKQLENWEQKDRLVFGASVHPKKGNMIDELNKAHARGARVLKVHPEVQRIYPDQPEMFPVYERCGQLGMPVVFHAGRSGLEPFEFLGEFAPMHRYVAPIHEYPNTEFVFGHSGSRDYREAIDIALEYPNVTLESSSIGLSDLQEVYDRLGPERIVFGSDWPWYPIAYPLAKLLIVTRGDRIARNLVLEENARRLLSS
jgi:predicted TIM-barrel fold metal-dependent hydrolase